MCQQKYRTQMTLLVILLSFATSYARTGIGVMIGEPTGISIKKWHSTKKAIDAAIAWSLEEDGLLHIHADYLHHNYNLLSEFSRQRRLPAYIGIGGRFTINDRPEDDLRIGMRFPVGFSYLFKDYPFDLFFELAPTFDVIPETSFEMNGAIGARFYF